MINLFYILNQLVNTTWLYDLDYIIFHFVTSRFSCYHAHSRPLSHDGQKRRPRVAERRHVLVVARPVPHAGDDHVLQGV